MITVITERGSEVVMFVIDLKIFGKENGWLLLDY